MKKILLTALMLSTLGCSVSAQADNQYTKNSDGVELDISLMRERWRDNFIPNNKLDKSLLQLYITKLDEDSLGLWHKLNKNKSDLVKLWPDVVLDSASTQGKLTLGSNLYTVYQRLFTLAKAYKTPGAELYGNKKVKLFLINTLTVLNKKYYNDVTAEYGNWWHWELGISRVVNNTLVVLYDDLDKSIIRNYNRATAYFVKRPDYLAESSGAPYSSTKNTFLSTGGNRSDAATVVFVRGLLENNPQEIKSAVNSLPAVLDTVTTGDGFYKDHSFIQHKDLPYTGTYGQVLLSGLGLIKNSISGTSLDFSAPDNKKLYSAVNNSFAPWLYEGKMLDAVNGRSISRAKEQNKDVGIGVINAVALFVDGAPAEEKATLLRILKTQLTDETINYYRSKLPDSLLSWQIVNNIRDTDIPVAKDKPHGYLFADMDRLLYKGDGFATVVAMHSNRTGSYECINGENLKGQRTSDGMTYIYISGNEDYYNYWPVVDSNYLPGTTAAGKIGNCDEQYRTDRLGHANIAWAGGIILEQYAGASIHLKVPEHSLQAKKSWFITPDMIVMLGEGIKSPEPAVTTVDNRMITDQARVTIDDQVIKVADKVAASNISLIENGKQITYQNLYQQKAIVSRTRRSADWSAIGTSSGKIDSQFLTILQQHDYSNKYGWVIYPNSAEKTLQLPAILANTVKVQAIKLPVTDVIYANFWRSSAIDGIKGLTPLAMIMIPVATGYHVAVSSPRRDSRVSFQLAKRVRLAKDPDNRVTVKDNIVSVDARGLSGTSYVFTLDNN